MHWYRTKEWQEFRAKIIELDGFKCVQCNRHQKDGAILQVHHKVYIRGKKPWEYAPDDCETLCKRCHAEKHEIVFPRFNWVCVAEDDLGDLIGTCDVCDTEIRYVFTLEHENWFSVDVGTDCCDRMTGTQIASEWRKRLERKRRFLKSKRWKPTPHGPSIKLEASDVSVAKSGLKYKIGVNGRVGRKEFDDEIAARTHVFKIFSDGQLKEWISKSKSKR